jgi:hypothetical protein
MCRDSSWGLAVSHAQGDTEKGCAHGAKARFLPIPLYGLREAHSPNLGEGVFCEVR